MSSLTPSILWEMKVTFWVAGGILIIVSILPSDLKWKQKLNGPLPRTSLRGWNFSRSMRNSSQSLSWNVDGYIKKWRNIKIHWSKIHLRPHHLFPLSSFHILNNHDRHRLLLWSPHLTLMNRLWLPPVLWNTLGIWHLLTLPLSLLTPPIFHYSLHLQCSKFLLSIIVMVDHAIIDIVQ